MVILETVLTCIEKTMVKLEDFGYKKEDIKGLQLQVSTLVPL